MCALMPAALPARVVHVAPEKKQSSATGDGSLARPYTLRAAQLALRGQAAGATVLLRGGDYFVDAPLQFVAEG